MFASRNESILLKVKVDSESLLGKLTEINRLAEELREKSDELIMQLNGSEADKENTDTAEEND